MEKALTYSADMQNIWTRESDDQLFLLREKGLTFSQIGFALGRTKNSVMGRYTRLKNMRKNHSPDTYRIAVPAVNEDEVKRILELRKSGLTPPAIAKIINRSADAVRRQIKLHCHIETFSVRDRAISPSLGQVREFRSSRSESYMCFSDMGGVTLEELKPDTCRWPVGDPKKDDFRYCGGAALLGRSYCRHHHAIAYRYSSTTSLEQREAEQSHKRALAGGLK